MFTCPRCGIAEEHIHVRCDLHGIIDCPECFYGETPLHAEDFKLESRPVMPSPMKPLQQAKPFYKSKGFWGSVIAAVAPLIPGVGPVLGIVGGVLAGVGRAQAQGPLTLGK